MSRGAGRLMPPGGADPPLDGQTPVYEPTGADPRIAPGLDRPPGSIARFGISTYLQKTGTAPTAWGTWAAGGGVGGISAGTQSAGSGTIVFSNSNGISFGLSGSSQLTASFDGIRAVSAGIGSIAPGATLSLTQAANGMVSLLVSGASIGVSANAVVAAVNNGGVGTTTPNGTVVFSSANNISFGIANGAAGGAHTITASAISFARSVMVNNGYDRGVFIGDVSNGTIHVAPLFVPNPISATRADQIMNVSNSLSAAATITMRLGLYTMSGSTASQVSSTSRAWSYNSTMASSSYTQVSGTRYRSMALGTWNMTPGDYMMAVQWSVGTALTSGTHQPHGGRDISLDADEYQLGLGSRARYWNGGMFTVTSAALPASFHLTDINQSGSNDIIFVPFVTFAGTF